MDREEGKAENAADWHTIGTVSEAVLFGIEKMACFKGFWR
jgi:hypothetical protein